MLEKMGDFFDKRLDIYEEHQLKNIYGAREFYPFTAGLLPVEDGAKILDLGCGTGLELDHYFKINESARVTCIDVAVKMLEKLKAKFSGRNIIVKEGSYFEIPFERGYYDAAVSVESLHHFSGEEKVFLYKKIYDALKEDGYFVLTDYFALSEEQELEFRLRYMRIKEEEKKTDGLYHFDTPLTVGHELAALELAGFKRAEKVREWGATHTLLARK